MTRAAGGRALFSLIALSSLAAAQCPNGCDSLTPQWGFAESGGVDPKDGSFQQLLIDACPCYDQEPLINSLIYTGIDNQVTTDVVTVTMETANSPTVVTHMFSTATNTLFQPGGMVTVQYAVVENGGTESYGQAYYTYSPVTSITYVESTETIQATATTTASTTVTQTQTSTSTIPQRTNTTPCTTGTLTITGKASTSTVRSTITKPAVTQTTTSVTTVTVHASCVRGPAKKSKREVEMEERHLKRQAPNAGVGEQPWYPAQQGNPQSTTYTTGTTVETDTVTTTATATQTATTTTTTTVTPIPPTTAVCSSVQATTTVTPTVTSTRTTKIGGSTTTSTSTYTLTTTVWAHSPPPICSPWCPSHPWPHQLHTLKPTSSRT